MPPVSRHSRLRRVAGLLIAALPLAALTSLAAVRPRVENPHGSFKEECALCHDARGWKPAHVSARFDHSKYGFTLQGEHAAADCMSCHKSLEFKQPRFLCQSCHEDPHRGEMGADCARCHSARSFVDRAPMLRAHQLTRFPLTGSHAALECESCHRPAAQGQMQFVGTRAECQSCHMKEYDATRSPDHRTSGLPMECGQCHRTLTWTTRNFDHDRTRFPLTGAHRVAACMQCHTNGQFSGKPTACASCHQGDYDGAANPNHATAGFSTACQTCHTTTAWSPSSFNHDASWFPIYSGAHAGRWTQCSTCHTAPANFTVFTCLSCHPHSDRAATDGHHQSEPTYSYDSNSCYRCHPRGRR